MCDNKVPTPVSEKISNHGKRNIYLSICLMLWGILPSLAPLTSASGMKFFVLYDHVSTEVNYLFSMHAPQKNKKCLASPSSTPQVNP